MALIVVRCGSRLSLDLPPHAEVLDVSAVPTRSELRPLDIAAKTALPEDPTPSLDEIAAQPDVRHLSTPALAPQAPHLVEPLRIVVVGDDAALSAVLSRMMRGDYLWAEIAYVPTDSSSPAARNWGLPTDLQSALSVALSAPVHPVPLIRNDAGLAVAGSASISEWNNTDITGEIIVDDHVVVRHEGTGKAGIGTYGARLVPMIDAPGILAAKAVSPVAKSADLGLAEAAKSGFGGWLRSKFSSPIASGQLDETSICTGRAVQAGGPELRVIVDGVSAKRAVKRVTFYRHLRDLQVVRP